MARPRTMPRELLCLVVACCAASVLTVGGCADRRQVPAEVTESLTDVAHDCPLPQRRLDGSCCPLGQFQSEDGDHCAPVGPPECAAVVFGDPVACVPRWCWDWRLADGSACDVDAPGCLPEGRACSADELAAGAGCAAGSWPGGLAQACVPAGQRGAEAKGGADETLPSVTSPVGVPEPVNMPKLPRFCRNKADGRTRLCMSGEGGCAAGQMPDPDAPSTCIHIGVPWLCPPGFLTDSSVTTPEGALVACKPDPADCGLGLFGDIKPGANVLYVNVDAQPGGDGSLSAPLKSIALAVSLAEPGATIALAAGIYKESLVLTKPVTLRGRCAAMVRIDGQKSYAVGVQGEAAGNAVTLRGFSLGGAGGGILALGELKVAASRLFFDEVVDFGVLAEGKGAWLYLEDSVIAGTEYRDFHLGVGALAQLQGTLSLRRVRLTGNVTVALAVAGKGSTTLARDIVVDGTHERTGHIMTGQGVLVEQGGIIKVKSARVYGNRSSGVRSVGAGSTLDVQASIVQNSLPGSGKKARGEGVVVDAHSHGILTGVLIEQGRAAGLAAASIGTTVEVNGLWVRATQADSVTNDGGFGVRLTDDVHAQLSGVWLQGNRHAGLHVEGAGTQLKGTEILIDHTEAIASLQSAGYGIEVFEGAQVELARFRLSANRSTGLYIRHSGSVLTAIDWLIDSTKERPDDLNAGAGLSIDMGGAARMSAGRLHGNRVSGLAVFGASSHGSFAGVLVDGTRARPGVADGPSKTIIEAYGVGAAVFEGGSLEISGCNLTGNRWVGVQAFGKSSRLRATGCAVHDTQTEKGKGAYGIGMTATGGISDVQIQSCRLQGNHTAGLTVDKAAAIVHGSAILDTAAGHYQRMDASGKFIVDDVVELSDGVVVKDGVGFEMRHTLVSNQLRAAVLMDGGVSSLIANCALGGGLFGLARNGEGGLQLMDTWLQGSQANLVGSGGLYVPPPPSVIDE